jgi:ribosomal protein S18 acetylase RimI-like enzyme
VSLDITYYKRYRMDINLAGRQLPPCPTPENYRLVGWDDALMDAFVEAKYNSFRGELDSNVFPSLSTPEGCRRLMTDITEKLGFQPAATWLAIHAPPGSAKPEYCGTIQGIRDKFGQGAIQNVGITGPHRGKGLGTCLIYRCLEGFRRAGIFVAHLEVTAQNERAIALYHRLGFVTTKTMYKTVADNE